jgi:hypothetical protein
VTDLDIRRSRETRRLDGELSRSSSAAASQGCHRPVGFSADSLDTEIEDTGITSSLGLDQRRNSSQIRFWKSLQELAIAEP